jgi:hypothetical protein
LIPNVKNIKQLPVLWVKWIENAMSFISRCGMLLKVLDSCWALPKRVQKMPKDYWIASEHSLQGIGKLLGNAQLTQVPAGQMFLLA